MMQCSKEESRCPAKSSQAFLEVAGSPHTVMSSHSSLERGLSLRDGLLCELDKICNPAASLVDDELLGIAVEMPPEEEDGKSKASDDDPGIPGKDPWCTLSSYGGASAFDEKELKDLIGPNQEGGLIWTAQLVGEGVPVKPRRGMPFPVTAKDFLSSVKRIGTPSIEAHAEAGYDDLYHRDARHESSDCEAEEARWVFKGVLNGWPGLTLLEVREVYAEEPESLLRKMLPSTSRKKKIWGSHSHGNERGIDLADAINIFTVTGSKDAVITVELRAPTWSSQGWSSTSPGFVMWIEGANVDERNSCIPSNLTINFGTNIIKSTIETRDPACTMVHMVNHRYASPNRIESARDRLLYHSIVLLEWDHQNYCSVVEIGFLNGLGGYKCKSNWVEDKDATPYSQIYAAFPSELVLPWKTTLSEIRVTNVPFKNKDDLIENYMKTYEGRQGRFVDTNCSFSHEVRLTFNLRSHIATYLVNYILRDKTYSEMKRNCQTFAADLCGFLAGKKDVSPYHPVNQIQYHNSTHTFLYESSKYSKKKRSKLFLLDES
jgi:hypothetical protein